MNSKKKGHPMDKRYVQVISEEIEPTMKCSSPVVIKGIQIKTRCSSVCPSIVKNLKDLTFNVGKYKRKLAVSSIEGGTVNCCSLFKDSLAVSVTINYLKYISPSINSTFRNLYYLSMSTQRQKCKNVNCNNVCDSEKILKITNIF